MPIEMHDEAEHDVAGESRRATLRRGRAARTSTTAAHASPTMPVAIPARDRVKNRQTRIITAEREQERSLGHDFRRRRDHRSAVVAATGVSAERQGD